MSKLNLESIDKKIGDLVALMAFYSSLNLALVALGDAAPPEGHDHFIVCLLAQGKTIFKKDANKAVVKMASRVLKPSKGTKKEKQDLMHDLKWQINHESKKAHEKFVALVARRHAMAVIIDKVKARAIIKSAAKKPTVAKARAHVKKEAKRHGVEKEQDIHDYLE